MAGKFLTFFSKNFKICFCLLRLALFSCASLTLCAFFEAANAAFLTSDSWKSVGSTQFYRARLQHTVKRTSLQGWRGSLCLTENFSVTQWNCRTLELLCRPYVVSLQEITLPADLLLKFINFSTKILARDWLIFYDNSLSEWSSKWSLKLDFWTKENCVRVTFHTWLKKQRVDKWLQDRKESFGWLPFSFIFWGKTLWN